MLGLAKLFLMITLIAALAGLTGLAGVATGIAQVLAGVFCLFFVLALMFSRPAQRDQRPS